MGYITDIIVIEGKSASAPAGYIKIDTDINKAAGGKYLYICYKVEENPRDAIDDIIIVSGEKPTVPYGYTLVDMDLNKGAGGEYLYICYRKNFQGARSVYEIRVTESNEQYWEKGWTTIPTTLNAGTSGAVLWLSFKRRLSAADWMSGCSDDTPVQYLQIPGTHDTVTYAKPLSFIYSLLIKTAQCQKYSIEEQLNMGVRYFDIRVNDSLIGQHGVVSFDIHLNSIFNQIGTFLKQHPSEAIFIRFKTEHPADGYNESKYAENILSAIKNLLEPNVWHNEKNNVLPTLKEVRGKVVFFDELRIKNGTYENGMGYVYGNGALFDTQDNYNHPDEDEKYKEIVAMQQKDIKNKLKLNHVSATGTAAGVLPGTWYPLDYATYLNPKICNFLLTSNNQTGIMIFDFINSYIANRVYIKNFPFPENPYTRW